MAVSQSDIASFTSSPNSNYAVVSPTGVVDESASGADLTWDFTSLVQDSTVQNTYAAPTAEELSTYPGTTTVLSVTNTASSTANLLFLKEDAAGVSLTGTDEESLDLNFADDNAFIGDFPLSYNYDNTDNIAGSFSSLLPTGATATGTFSGTINSNVDAYGTLNINDLGAGAYSDAVTRLKTVEDFILNVTSPVTTTREVTRTIYYYYDNQTGELILRSSTADIVAPTGATTTTQRIEVFKNISSSTDDEIFESNITAYPNPANDILRLDISNNYNLVSVNIYNIQGQLLISKNENLSNINVANLKTGAYAIQLISDDGKKAVKTFIKK